MSIPALGGGANQAIQRALRDAERAFAEGIGGENGDDPAATATRAASGGAATSTTRGVRRRGGQSTADTAAPFQDEAIVVELGDRGEAERLQVAGGWITKQPAGAKGLETKGMPEPKRFDGDNILGETEEETSAARTSLGRSPLQPNPTAVPSAPAGPAAPAADPAATGAADAPAAEADAATSGATAPSRPEEGVSLDRLIVVLKQTGISFRDAYQVLREIHAGGPLPPKAELQRRWAIADPDAWEAHGGSKAATTPDEPTAARPIPARAETERPPARPADTDLRRTAVDDVIRDRAWHRDNPDAARADHRLSLRDEDPRPTLQSIVRQDPANQAYVAALSTAEFQRLVTVLGRTAPEWFWNLRGHRGLRGLAERPTIAKLNTTRFAGTRLGAWLLATAGTAGVWYVGVHTGSWW
jgi:hypothetical protein